MSFLDKLSLKGSSKVGNDNYQAPEPVLPEYTGLISNGSNEGGAPPSYDHLPSSAAHPPSYAAVKNSANGYDDELDGGFSSLTIAVNAPAFPEADQCLAHLKLLSALHVLKEDIGYADGLFGLFDAKCDMATNRDASLVKMREKRWALYVARAADRFQDWWLKVLCKMEPSVRLEGNDMASGAANFTQFTKAGKARQWTARMLPPLDVLMVWHSFMLNPRAYLEDCIRFGLKDLWATGIPWSVVTAAIDVRFKYEAPEEAKTNFATTGHAWDNQMDEMKKTISCARCSQGLEVQWTTCCSGEKTSPRELLDMSGYGYGDRQFAHACQNCGAIMNHDFLRIARLKEDVENLVLKDWPLSGTILCPNTGIPDVASEDEKKIAFNTFPNRLFRLALKDSILELVGTDAPSIENVKVLVERAIADKATVKGINSKTVFESGVLQRYERLATRKMMTCYWENSSIFAIELGSAVVRQGVFVDKMYSIDWIHSPAARETMERLLIKYSRFIKMMATFPLRIAVPTLDVDLGWHTHQLSSKSYYEYTISKAKRFINHDDKIDEDSLSKHFQWTSKEYENEYSELYSECTCWYSIRAQTHTGKIFGVSKQEKAQNRFHDSGAAKLCPPDKSAHISAHSSVTMVENPLREAIVRIARKHHDRELEEAYMKASKRAKAKGRPAPERSEYYQGAWGYPMLMYGPYMSVGLLGGIYYAGDPCVGSFGAGSPGNCATGTCGSGVLPVGSSGGMDIAYATGGYGGGTGGACGGGGGGGCGGGGS
ncbi:related to large-conductance mechanosensitive channel [Rhynchosporium agropyri]|uniref:Related to large-conductance mechanosensitive channel n=1 Tax=Rhynchosporium agropyri TaxID=914238 RepID=A0A1E1KLD3_9HELO|nr:related to large-conductance mechanosensitive channel [Rhynchosporium agropyri]